MTEPTPLSDVELALLKSGNWQSVPGNIHGRYEATIAALHAERDAKDKEIAELMAQVAKIDNGIRDALNSEYQRGRDEQRENDAGLSVKHKTPARSADYIDGWYDAVIAYAKAIRSAP